MSGDAFKEQGLQHFRQKSYEAAVAAFETAVSHYAAQNEIDNQAEMLNNIGVIKRLQKKHEAAAAALVQAADLFAQAGDKRRQGQAIGNLGDVFAAQRDRLAAARSYSEAAALLAQAQAPAEHSQVLRALSLLYLRQGRWFDAIYQMNDSLRIKPRKGVGEWLLSGLLRLAVRLIGGG